VNRSPDTHHGRQRRCAGGRRGYEYANIISSQGQVWEVADGCDVQIQYLFSAPITFSGSGKLAAGERVRIMTETAGPEQSTVSFLPVRHEELKESLVPADVRNTPRYKDFLLSVKTGYFFEHFRLVEDAAGSAGEAPVGSN